MKKLLYELCSFLVCIFFCFSCSEYLDIPEEANKTKEEVFGTYFSFQSYIDQIYNKVCDPINFLTSSPNFGGETVATTAVTVAYKAIRGSYLGFLSRSMYQSVTANGDTGLWIEAWEAIRMANLGLENLKFLKATAEEVNLIEGQLLFFRAYFHLELISAWGPMPYVDKVLSADETRLPRYFEYKGKKNFQACVEHIVEDLDKAAFKLPIVWKQPSINLGRVTKQAAYGYMAKALMFAGSPLMNENSGNSSEVNVDYMKRAAEAAAKVLVIAEENPNDCGLVDWANYQGLFTTTTGRSIWTKETLWGRMGFKTRVNEKGSGLFNNRLRAYVPDGSTYGGNTQHETLTQNYVDKFEMADGTLYKEEYDSDNALRWDFRDPRFKFNVYVDRDNPVNDEDKFKLHLYKGGRTMTAVNGSLTPYVLHKFWPKNVCSKLTPTTPETNNFMIMTPLLRLAEIYLIYAEAVYEGYKDYTNKTVGNCKLTALDAVKIVRQRAGHVAEPNIEQYKDKLSPRISPFTTLVLNERAVEFCSEASQYWFDIRRWKIGELLNKEIIYTLDFDENWTPSSFVRREIIKRVFENRNYWLPIPQDQTQIYKEFPQNPGWE